MDEQDIPRMATPDNSERLILITVLARRLANEIENNRTREGREIVARLGRILDYAKALA